MIVNATEESPTREGLRYPFGGPMSKIEWVLAGGCVAFALLWVYVFVAYWLS